MHDLFHRAAVGVVLVAGVLTGQSPLVSIHVTPPPLADRWELPVVWHITERAS